MVSDSGITCFLIRAIPVWLVSFLMTLHEADKRDGESVGFS